MEQQNVLGDLTVDATASRELREVAKWGKFLSIIGFIVCGLFVLVGIFAGSIFSSFNKYDSYGSNVASGMGVAMIFIYVILAVVYFFPTLFLFQSSVKMKEALNTSSQELFNEALTKLKACFRYWGIMTIIIISIYALVFLIAGLTMMR